MSRPTHAFKNTNFVSHGKTLPQVVLINLETVLIDCKNSWCVNSSALRACCLVCAYCIVTYQNLVERNSWGQKSVSKHMHLCTLQYKLASSYHDSVCLRGSRYEICISFRVQLSARYSKLLLFGAAEIGGERRCVCHCLQSKSKSVRQQPGIFFAPGRDCTENRGLLVAQSLLELRAKLGQQASCLAFCENAVAYSILVCWRN